MDNRTPVRTGRDTPNPTAVAKPPKVTVARLDRLANAGNLKATFDVRIGHDFLLRDCRLIHDPNHNTWWVSPPVREYMKDGQKKFWPLADWPRHWHVAICDAAVATYRTKEPQTFGEAVREKAGLAGGAAH